MTPEQKTLLEHKRALLVHKLEAKREREGTQSLALKLPPEVANYLQNAPQLFSDEEFTDSLPWYPPENNIYSDGWYKGDDRPTDYYYKRFGWEHKIIAALGKLPRVHEDKPTYLKFVTRLEAYGHHSPSYPLFTVPLGWLHDHLPLLATNITLYFWAITTDGYQGIYTDNHGGYVEDDWGPDETVYELTVYGHGAVTL